MRTPLTSPRPVSPRDHQAASKINALFKGRDVRTRVLPMLSYSNTVKHRQRQIDPHSPTKQKDYNQLRNGYYSQYVQLNYSSQNIDAAQKIVRDGLKENVTVEKLHKDHPTRSWDNFNKHVDKAPTDGGYLDQYRAVKVVGDIQSIQEFAIKLLEIFSSSRNASVEETFTNRLVSKILDSRDPSRAAKSLETLVEYLAINNKI